MNCHNLNNDENKSSPAAGRGLLIADVPVEVKMPCSCCPILRLEHCDGKKKLVENSRSENITEKTCRI